MTIKKNEITMATVKSYTDVAQSKKLAEILPLESADMMYSPPMLTHFRDYGDADKEQEIPDYMVIHVRCNIINDSEFDEPIPIRKGDFPCWSVARLLDILKDRIIFGGNSPEGWFCCYTIKNPTKTLTIYGDSLVDACYELILKLHELEML